jgi:histone deacetylase 6
MCFVPVGPVQILTHMKEKLHFIEGENQALTQQLQELEAALAGSRDELAGLKAARDKMRQQGRQLKENSVYVSNPMLLQDMQVSLPHGTTTSSKQ